MLCPKCKKNEMTVYNGSLGYESVTCKYCNLDVKSEEALSYFNTYTSELRYEVTELKDKLSRRNMQIKDLKKTKLCHNEIVTLRDCLSEDILVREAQIKSRFTTEAIDRPIIKDREILKNKLNKIINL